MESFEDDLTKKLIKAKKQNQIIKDKILHLIDDWQARGFQAETILHSIKSNLKFNRFEDDEDTSSNKTT